MDFQISLKFLNSLVDYSLIPNMDNSTEKFNLQRVYDLLLLMGNPHLAYPVIHVGGTKGKGSTAVMTAAILKAAGYKVGLFTSPYLFDFCEQIQINGEPIPQDEVVRQVEAIKPLLDQVKGITTFEAVTTICFKYFKEQKVDIAIIEVGFGGAMDATSVVQPLLTVLTSISYDHTAIMGNTIEEIAESEAGIIKQGSPLVVAPQVFPKARQTIQNIAKRMDTDLIFVDEAIKVNEVTHSLDRQVFSVNFLDHDVSLNGDYILSLLGHQQLENASTALTVVGKLNQLGFSINKGQISQGLQEARWPCRFEVVSNHPLIVLDGAHNVDSAQKLKLTITEYLDKKKIILIFGASVDKDLAGMLDILMPGVEKVIFSKSSHPRAAEPAMLVKLVKCGSVPFEVTENIADALKLASSMTDEKMTIVVTGSLFIAAAARQVILNS